MRWGDQISPEVPLFQVNSFVQKGVPQSLSRSWYFLCSRGSKHIALYLSWGTILGDLFLVRRDDHNIAQKGTIHPLPGKVAILRSKLGGSRVSCTVRASPKSSIKNTLLNYLLYQVAKLSRELNCCLSPIVYNIWLLKNKKEHITSIPRWLLSAPSPFPASPQPAASSPWQQWPEATPAPQPGSAPCSCPCPLQPPAAAASKLQSPPARPAAAWPCPAIWGRPSPAAWCPGIFLREEKKIVLGREKKTGTKFWYQAQKAREYLRSQGGDLPSAYL